MNIIEFTGCIRMHPGQWYKKVVLTCAIELKIYIIAGEKLAEYELVEEQYLSQHFFTFELSKVDASLSLPIVL